MQKRKESIMHEQVLVPGQSAVKVKWNDFPHFTFPWHFHSEMEIVYVLKSEGTRFVGDSMERFGEGDLVLVGSQLPHYWKNDLEYYESHSQLRVNAVVVQFAGDFMDKAIQAYSEMSHIKELFVRAASGVHFTMPENRRLCEMVKALYHFQGFERILQLLKVLDAMAKSKSYRLLAASDYKPGAMSGADYRIEKVLNFINLNYTREISLAAISGQFGMNGSAFSRFFKQKTGKTLVRYVNEMRIGYACKLLQERSLSVSQICYECGFNNISNFNRFFKERMGVSPRRYIAAIQ
jgi:AraC-like DNA-binding protein